MILLNKLKKPADMAGFFNFGVFFTKELLSFVLTSQNHLITLNIGLNDTKLVMMNDEYS